MKYSISSYENYRIINKKPLETNGLEKDGDTLRLCVIEN